MADPFIIKALLAGIGVSLMAAPLGCFVAWQRMAYFGDAIAHAALLGVALSVVSGVSMPLGIMTVAVVVTLMVAHMEAGKKLAADTLLGMLAHGALALGLVLIALSPHATIDLNALLFGDILAVSREDIVLIFAVAIAVCLLLILRWRDLMRNVLHPDIAAVEGIGTRRLKLLLMLAIALAVAVSIKVVGILLITSMLIIPAAGVRYLSRTPTEMAVLSVVAGVLAVCGGLFGSLTFDTPSGASIILAALAVFACCYAVGRVSSAITGT